MPQDNIEIRTQEEPFRMNHYWDAELAQRLEALHPHQELSFEFPENQTSRGMLNPFLLTWQTWGYCGLDEANYEIMRAAQLKYSTDTKATRNITLTEFLATKDAQVYLETREVNSKKVFFPSQTYVLNSKANAEESNRQNAHISDSIKRIRERGEN